MFEWGFVLARKNLELDLGIPRESIEHARALPATAYCV